MALATFGAYGGLDNAPRNRSLRWRAPRLMEARGVRGALPNAITARANNNPPADPA
jgi:hypothetical protein